MQELRREARVGLDYLDAVTTLAQRARSAHPTAGLYEAADFAWWWRIPRATDVLPQLFWFDANDRPQAAVIVTEWSDRVALDPIFMPDASADLIAEVVAEGLAHAAASGFDRVTLEADPAHEPIRDALTGQGLLAGGPAIVEAWLAADDRPEISRLSDGYVQRSRLDTTHRPHHMAERNGPEVEARLSQTSLYRPDLDLLVIDSHDNHAASALFWFDPTTETGLVEPMGTEADHRQRGLARHLLTTGLDRLARAGAQHIKICYEPDNPPARDLYLSVGFEPVRETVSFSGHAAGAAAPKA